MCALAFAATACSGSHHGRPEHASAQVERAWVDRLQQWLATEALEGDFRKCSSRIAAQVGPAPSNDLQPLEHSVDTLCAGFKRAYTDLDRSFARHDLDLYGKSQPEMHRAEAAIPSVRGLVDGWHPGATVGLPTRGGITEVSRIEPRFSAAASVVAGTHVTVRCWSRADWPRIQAVAKREGLSFSVRDLGGLADQTAGTADLSPEACDALVATTYRGVHGGADAAFGLGLLAHEATHLREDAPPSEAATECAALQRIHLVGPTLGVSTGQARRLEGIYYAEIYPDDLPEYQSADCRPGGLLDLSPGDGRWP